MTAPGWARTPAAPGAGAQVRDRLGIAADAVVIGLVGSLNWRPRVGYVYGAELVRAVRGLERADMVALIVGDGPGRSRLEAMADGELGSRVLLPGAVPPSQVAEYLAAFDVASLPQSVDGVGAFRYSTKLSEYLAAGLPIITGQIPAAYDLDDGAIWRLPGAAPWSSTYVVALTAFLEELSRDEIERHRPAPTAAHRELFDADAQQLRVRSFIEDALARGER
jgi:glycosyltransferase involved in cell wall biosynthesis